MTETNYSMLCDFYELTMSNGYFKNGFYKKNVYFDLFFRKVPTTAVLPLRQVLSR